MGNSLATHCELKKSKKSKNTLLPHPKNDMKKKPCAIGNILRT
jgi:hypothetical protein